MKNLLLALCLATNVGLLAVALGATNRQTDSDDVVRTRRLDVVDEHGNLCAQIRGSNAGGGSLELFYPNMKVVEDEPKRIFLVGSPFPGWTLLTMQDSRGDGYGVTVQVNDADALAFSARSKFGKVEISSGQKKPKDPMLLIEDRNGEPLFLK